jgi:uncharacterized membrane protein YkoI
MRLRSFSIAIALIAVVLVPGVAHPSVPRQQGPDKTPAPPAATLTKLPPAVRATVEAETKNATLKDVSKEQEGGRTVYELETIVNGRTRDLMIDAAGKVYVVEEEISAEVAPPAVRAALEARGRIEKLESVLENGRTRYEAQVRTKAGKKITMDLEPDGSATKK